MRSKPVYIMAVGVSFAIGAAAGWYTHAARSHSPPAAGAVEPAAGAVEPAAMPQAGKARPDRRPEYFGVVERVEVSTFSAGKVVTKFLIRGQRPPAGMPEPTSPLFVFGGQADRLWVNIVDTQVERHGGPIGVGDLLSVWNQGEMITTYPGQVYPEYVISDPAPHE